MAIGNDKYPFSPDSIERKQRAHMPHTNAPAHMTGFALNKIGGHPDLHTICGRNAEMYSITLHNKHTRAATNPHLVDFRHKRVPKSFNVYL